VIATKPRSAKGAPRPPSSSTFVEPMKALAVSSIPAGDWLLEIKFDGYRALAIIDRKGRPELWSRNRNLLSEKYPEVTEALKKLAARDCVLDGEIVALDEAGRPRFQLLQGLAQKSRPPILYYVFDLLRLDGKSLLDQPIESRRAALERLLKRAPAALRLSPIFDEKPEHLLKEVSRQGLEGIIAKAAGSSYEPGRRSGTWLKCRIAHDQEFVIGGYTAPRGARSHFGALLVGHHEGGRLLYAGKVGTGFDEKKLSALHRRLAAVKTSECPFANLPMARKPRFGLGMTASAMRDVTWVEPKLVCQVRFTEWTREGSLRHPVFLGMRDDKNASEVVRETLAGD
jgi:bifunctional non-homologous end joining protein LigD